MKCCCGRENSRTASFPPFLRTLLLSLNRFSIWATFLSPKPIMAWSKTLPWKGMWQASPFKRAYDLQAPGLTKRLKIAEIKGKHLIAKYSIHDLDDLLGFIAAEANHTDDKKIGKKLDRVFERLTRILEKEIDNQ